MITKAPKETEKYEAFDLVANAWEELDLYQRSSDARKERDLYQRSADGAALENAVEFLNQARKEDPEYFKAYYLAAVTTYFTNPSRAAETFAWLLERENTDTIFREQASSRYWLESDNETEKGAQTTEHLNALNWEIRFNLTAAGLEAIAPTAARHEDIKKFRTEFGKLRAETKKDSPLDLLARSAHALCDALIGNETSAERRRIRWKLWLIELFPWRIELRKWRIRKTDIDRDTAAAIRKILRYVKDPKLWQKLSRPDQRSGELSEV